MLFVVKQDSFDLEFHLLYNWLVQFDNSTPLVRFLDGSEWHIMSSDSSLSSNSCARNYTRQQPTMLQIERAIDLMHDILVTRPPSEMLIYIKLMEITCIRLYRQSFDDCVCLRVQ